jgi:exodeoxyribonuclease-3
MACHLESSRKTRLLRNRNLVSSSNSTHQLGLSPSTPDSEGRLIEAEINGLRIASVYLPSGSSGPDRQAVKNDWLDLFIKWSSKRTEQKPTIFGGDINIAHTEKDIFYAKANEQTSGFLPHEREWFGNLLNSGWHDLVREHHGDIQGPYSWWSNRGKARELDREDRTKATNLLRFISAMTGQTARPAIPF